MDDRRTAEGVEHLQAAARELLGAARAFLDVVEEVVEDPERASSAVQGVSDLLRSGLGLGRRPQPWERAAWDDAERHDTGDRSESSSHADTSWWDEPFEDEDHATMTPRADEPAATTVPAKKAAAKKAPPKKAAAKKVAPAARPADRPSRVRRIAVD
jgi:hypothetical protein